MPWRVESNLAGTVATNLLSDFRWLLIASSLATIAGALLIPTFQVHRPVPRLILHGFFKGALSCVKDSATLPSSANVSGLRGKNGAITTENWADCPVPDGALLNAARTAGLLSHKLTALLQCGRTPCSATKT